MKKINLGIGISIAAAILAVVGLIQYFQAPFRVSASVAAVVAAVAFEAVLIVSVSMLGKASGLFNYFPVISAILMALGIGVSISPQVETIAMVVSGLNSFDVVRSYAFYLLFAFAGWILFSAASFCNVAGGTAEKR